MLDLKIGLGDGSFDYKDKSVVKRVDVRQTKPNTKDLRSEVVHLET